LLSLAKSNPRQAFAESLSWAEWAALPAETRALVERPFSAMAEYVVHHACSPGATNRSLAVSRHLVLEGQTYQAQVFGGLARIGSKSQMPVRGFVLSNLAVLCDRSIEPLKSADLEAAQVMLSQAEFVPNHEEAQGPSESLLYGGRIYRLDRHQAGQLRALDATAAQSLHPRSYALALAAGLNSTGDRLNSPRALKAAALASADWPRQGSPFRWVRPIQLCAERQIPFPIFHTEKRGWSGQTHRSSFRKHKSTMSRRVH
jgi:hypothetical protein